MRKQEYKIKEVLHTNKVKTYYVKSNNIQTAIKTILKERPEIDFILLFKKLDDGRYRTDWCRYYL